MVGLGRVELVEGRIKSDDIIVTGSTKWNPGPVLHLEVRSGNLLVMHATAAAMKFATMMSLRLGRSSNGEPSHTDRIGTRRQFWLGV